MVDNLDEKESQGEKWEEMINKGIRGICFFVLSAMLLHLNANVARAEFNYTPIYDIQYTTDPSGDSPLNGTIVTTEGIITALFYYGVFIQYHTMMAGRNTKRQI